MSDNNIVVHGLSRLDYLELAKRVGKDEAKYQSEHKTGDEYGELVSGAVILTLTPIALTALSILLARRHKQSVFSYICEVKTSEVVKRIEVHFDTSESEAPNADIIKQIGESLKIDVSAALRRLAESKEIE